MRSPVSHFHYFAFLKGKAAEIKALGSAPEPLKSFLCPVIDVPPSGYFDHQTGRILGPLEHIKTFGARLFAEWGKRFAFVDASNIDDEKHKLGLTAHPLTELIERGWLAGAIVCPVTALRNSIGYQEAVRRFAERNPTMPICLRLNPSDLENPNLDGTISDLLEFLNVDASRFALVLDFGDISAIDPDSVESFVEVLITRINDLPRLHDWLALVLACSSFPEKIALKPTETQIYGRSEEAIYTTLLAHNQDVLRLPTYGDYAVEHPKHRKPVRAQPSAHVRYTLPGGFLVAKGKSTKKPNGYEAIYPVADAVVGHEAFYGKRFSRGDDFLDQLARLHGKTGNASTWRWAAIDHHFALVLQFLGALSPTPVQSVGNSPQREPQVEMFFAEPEPKK